MVMVAGASWLRSSTRRRVWPMAGSCWATVVIALRTLLGGHCSARARMLSSSPSGCAASVDSIHACYQKRPTAVPQGWEARYR